MIILAFSGPKRKIVKFTINNREVKYYDEHFPAGLQVYPLNKSLVGALAMSRSIQLRQRADWIAEANQGKNLEEYKSCKTDEDIAEIIKKDAKSQGLLLVK